MILGDVKDIANAVYLDDVAYYASGENLCESDRGRLFCRIINKYNFIILNLELVQL